MRKLILNISTSLDGYIADENNHTDWILNPEGYGYDDFYESVDTTIMGRKTYEFIVKNNISFPYTDKKNYVLTRTEKQANDHVEYIHKDPEAFVYYLKAQKGKDIWLVGGGETANLYLEANLVDEIILSVNPIILGNGVPLFRPSFNMHRMDVVITQVFENGLVQLQYEML
ncbi:MAG: dihydrofolate reductase family protein [Cytophagaceae bacterium]|nr:dihydrofolate reductase family protein [Cytophagaceae bacterium]MDW8456123.1 dihydrofolate reductase family protein [Cytophagaceae bacterium]